MSDNAQESEAQPAKTSQKREEIFRRLKINSFVTMALQTAQLQYEEEMVFEALGQMTKDLEVSKMNNDQENVNEINNYGSAVHHRSAHSVIHGYGEVDTGNDVQVLATGGHLLNKPENGPQPYLLLDVRLEDDYKLGRIITAINYPYTLLSRATNYESADMLASKNKPGKMIIVYDDEERLSPRVATTLLQRGYDNVVVLSGGVKMALTKYPIGLTTGQFPNILIPTETTTKGKSKKKAPNLQKKNTKLKDSFTKEDLEMLKQQLQYNLLPAASKSRLVKSTSASKIRNETTRKQKSQIVRNGAWR